jgi:hypothetical protein
MVKLSPAYDQRAWAVTKERLRDAGRDLAMRLNEAFSSN